MTKNIALLGEKVSALEDDLESHTSDDNPVVQRTISQLQNLEDKFNSLNTEFETFNFEKKDCSN